MASFRDSVWVCFYLNLAKRDETTREGESESANSQPEPSNQPTVKEKEVDNANVVKVWNYNYSLFVILQRELWKMFEGQGTVSK